MKFVTFNDIFITSSNRQILYKLSLLFSDKEDYSICYKINLIIFGPKDKEFISLRLSMVLFGYFSSSKSAKFYKVYEGIFLVSK